MRVVMLQEGFVGGIPDPSAAGAGADFPWQYVRVESAGAKLVGPGQEGFVPQGQAFLRRHGGIRLGRRPGQIISHPALAPSHLNLVGHAQGDGGWEGDVGFGLGDGEVDGFVDGGQSHIKLRAGRTRNRLLRHQTERHSVSSPVANLGSSRRIGLGHEARMPNCSPSVSFHAAARIIAIVFTASAPPGVEQTQAQVASAALRLAAGMAAR